MTVDNDKTKLWAKVKFSVIPGEEMEDYKRHARGLGYATELEVNEFIEAVEENLALSAFGWCDVEVRAVLELETSTGRKFRVQGTAYLGCCSYKSEEDFRENSGYFEQMKDEAFEDLLGMLRKTERDGAAAAMALSEWRDDVTYGPIEYIAGTLKEV